MKKILATLLLALVAFQGAALAGSIAGTVKSVDAAASSLIVTTDTGDSTVSFSAETAWPSEVIDPATLVGKSVTVTTDEAGAATAVEEAAA